MEDFHCEVLELSFRVKAGDIDKAALLKATNKKSGVSEISLIYGSRGNKKQHSHIGIRFSSEERVQVRIVYHNTPGDVAEDEQPPYMEECAQWLGRFIKLDKVTVNENAFFFFGKDFTSRIPLPYPFIALDEELAGCSITGLSIKYPEGSAVESAIVQGVKDEVAISVFIYPETDIKKFDLYAELKRLEASILPLVKKVKKRGKTREDRSEK